LGWTWVYHSCGISILFRHGSNSPRSGTNQHRTYRGFWKNIIDHRNNL
jgi:hypothetical protein